MAKFSLQAFLYLCIAAVANAFIQNGAARSMMKAGNDHVHIFIYVFMSVCGAISFALIEDLQYYV